MDGQGLVYANNGGSGPTLAFTLHRTIALSGSYITDLEIVDYDDDGDNDIIALGQEHYYMANDLSSTLGSTIGTMTVYYIQNTGTAMSVEDQTQISSVLFRNQWWVWWDGKFDLTTGDLDDDDDIDAAVIYGADTDGDADNNAERIRVTGVYYDDGSLTQTVLDQATPAISWTWGFIKAADMDEDGYTDLVFTRMGTTVHIMWNDMGTLDPSIQIAEFDQPASTTRVPYALDVGHFAGNSWLDIIISTNEAPEYKNINGNIWMIKQLTGTGGGRNTFSSLEVAYGELNHFAFRGFAVGRLSNETTNHGDDLITFTKKDSTPAGTTEDTIDSFGITALKSQTASPKKLALIKYYDENFFTTTHLNAIASGNLDNDPEGYSDFVYVGDDITIGTTSWPDDKMPSVIKERSLQTPSPVLNNNLQQVTVNITVRDDDGVWDLDKLEADFTMIPGMEDRTFVVETPNWEDPQDSKVASYIFSFKVPPEVPAGDHDIELRIFGKFVPKDVPKAIDTFTFRVKQYNRAPVINITQPILYIQEDTVTTLEGVYHWFKDQDGNQMDIKIVNPFVQNSYITSIENTMFLAELINGTLEEPELLALRITPKPDVHHDEFGGGGPSTLTLRAFDYELKSEEMPLTVRIVPVNDLATLKPQGSPNDDFTYQLEQDDPGFTVIKAADPKDDDPEGRDLGFSFNYSDPADELWLTINEDGKVTWNPKNEHVGPHMVTLLVNDSYDIIEKVLWFNVTNRVDRPVFISASNQTTTLDADDLKETGRLTFVVYEHDEVNITFRIDDPDRWIGNQTEVFFTCNLTLGTETYLDVDPSDPFKANLHFMAELENGYPATFEPTYPPIDTEIMVVDPYDAGNVFGSTMYIPIRIIIININDAPVFARISKPEEGNTSRILYHIEFRAESGLDPDAIYGDHLKYSWDFDARDGIGEDRNGTMAKWDFPAAGTYKVTLRVIDSGGLWKMATVNITVNGIKNDTDWDNDGMPNQFEIDNLFNPENPDDAGRDADGDQLTNLEEYLNKTNPTKPDTDGDSYWDNIDWDPLDGNVWEEPKPKEGWLEDPIHILIIVIVVAAILVLLIVMLVLYVVRSRKKAEEEEAKRKMAEEMQKNMYEGQDLYAELPQLQAQAEPSAEPAPIATAEGLDDIFGGAGVLPTLPGSAAQPQQQALPPSEGAEPVKEQGPSRSDDLSDLFD